MENGVSWRSCYTVHPFPLFRESVPAIPCFRSCYTVRVSMLFREGADAVPSMPSSCSRYTVVFLRGVLPFPVAFLTMWAS